MSDYPLCELIVTGSEHEVDRFLAMATTTWVEIFDDGQVNEYSIQLDLEHLAKIWVEVSEEFDELALSNEEEFEVGIEDYYEAYEYESVPPESGFYESETAFSTKLISREAGRAVFSFRARKRGLEYLFSELSRSFPKLEFQCQCLLKNDEWGNWQWLYQASNGECSVEETDLNLIFPDLGLEGATPQSSLVTLQEFGREEVWSSNSHLLGEPQEPLLLALRYRMPDFPAGIYEWSEGGTFRLVHDFPGEELDHFWQGSTVAGLCLFLRTSSKDDSERVKLWRLDASGQLHLLLSLTNRTFDPVQGHRDSESERYFPWPLVQMPAGEFYSLKAGKNTHFPPGTIDGSGERILSHAGSLVRLSAGDYYEYVHHFNETDGSAPSTLILAADGFLYGSTASGGNPGPLNPPVLPPGGNCPPGSGHYAYAYTRPGGYPLLSEEEEQRRAQQHFEYLTQPQPRYPGGCGVLFRFVPDQGLDVLHCFSGEDGAHPVGQLLLTRDGSLYGTTLKGGSHDCGTLYRFDFLRGLTVLHSFTPEEGKCRFGVTEANNGDVVGTTAPEDITEYWHGGMVFRYRPTQGFTVLHRFECVQDLQKQKSYFPNGRHPSHKLVAGPGNRLYGFTSGGGTRFNGTFFSIEP